ncbi:MAG: serine/threonine protein kinase [Archangiaceae bacterium]|nr:serine/threonine protein kinase [Archangiaceae bacterium]
MDTSSCPPEEELVELSDGALPLSRATELQAHVERCASCHAALAALSTRSNGGAHPSASGAPLPAAGDRVDRFIVLEWVGGGAMGRVCAAYDTTLHRKVALKFLTSTEGAVWSQAHVEREARALARVAHPNVVTLFEVGVHGDTAFLAMEFVDGVNLRQWLAQEQRGAAAICEAFTQAAEGLLAAHRAGILHRDFKPENVLVGRDGRVRVSDFGLAADGSASAGLATAADPLLGVQPLSSRALTVAAVGTPAYMAPELWSKEKPTVQADVFAFSVALYEALAGRRPFPDGASERLKAIHAGALAPLVGVDRPLRDAVARGLAAKRVERPESLEPFIAALRPAPRRRALAWALVPLVLLAVGGWRWLDARARQEACAEAARASAHLTRPEVLEGLRARFGGELAQAGAFSALEDQLEAFSVRWSAQRRTACLESASPEQRSRAACLDRKLDQLLALEAVLQTANARGAAASPKAVDTLGDLSECARAPVASAAVPAPPREVVAQLDQLVAVFETGDYGRAYELAVPLEAAARQTQNDAFMAEALRAIGRARNAHGEDEVARQLFAESAELAVKAGDANAEARALMMAAAVTAIDLGRPDEGLLLLRLSRVAAQRGQLPPELEARASLVEGRMLVSAGRPQPAVAAFQRALDVWTRAAVPPRHDLLRLRGEMASALHGIGRREEAIVLVRAAIAESEVLMDKKYPLAASWWHNQGLMLRELGRLEEARDCFLHALAIHSPEGPGRCLYLETQSALAATRGQLGASDALANVRQVRADLVASECKSGPVEWGWVNQATVEAALGHHHEALASLAQAAAVSRAAQADRSYDALKLEAEQLEAAGRVAEAKISWEKALADRVRQGGDAHPDAALCRERLARLK